MEQIKKEMIKMKEKQKMISILITGMFFIISLVPFSVFGQTENNSVEDKSSNIVSSTINNNIGTIKISHKNGGIFEFTKK